MVSPRRAVYFVGDGRGNRGALIQRACQAGVMDRSQACVMPRARRGTPAARPGRMTRTTPRLTGIVLILSVALAATAMSCMDYTIYKNDSDPPPDVDCTAVC